jgi:hypothetical protein
VLSNEVHDAPAPVSLLDVANGERRHLRPLETAVQEDFNGSKTHRLWYADSASIGR